MLLQIIGTYKFNGKHFKREDFYNLLVLVYSQSILSGV